MQLHEQVAGEDAGSLTAESLRLQEELLSLRDKALGNEAQLGVALGKVRAAESELLAYREAIERLDRSSGPHLPALRAVPQGREAIRRRSSREPRVPGQPRPAWPGNARP